MVVLLDCLLAVHLEKWRLGIKMIAVVESIMINVMAQSCNQDGEGVLVIELGMFPEILALQDGAAMLSNIRPMEIVVVGHASSVFIIDLGNETNEFSLVDAFEKVVLFEE